MAHPSLVAVYGLPVPEPDALRAWSAEPADPVQPERLGSGRLRGDRLVVLDKRLSRALGSADPPDVLRVGIASRLDGEPFVEVVEVRQVVPAAHAGDPGDVVWWAAELWTDAASPTDWEAESDGDFPTGPANGWCFLFPGLSFC